MSDQTEQQLFDIKSKFLREIPHPKLIRKSMDEVKTIAGTSLVVFEPRQTSYGDTTLSQALTVTTEAVLKLKLAISGSDTASELYNNLVSLYEVHWALLVKLASYLPVSAVYPDGEIKQSGPVDSYEIYRFISRESIGENEIKPYICNVIAGKAPADFDTLTTACLRSRKIITNG